MDHDLVWRGIDRERAARPCHGFPNKSVIWRASSILRATGVVCNCGGPQYGTDHSPDCAILLAWDDAVEEARQQIWDETTLEIQ